MIESIKDLRSRLENKIKSSSNIFILGHNSPDFDAIGSSIGLFALAESLGKKAYIIVDDEESRIEPGVKRIIDENRGKYRICKKEKFLKMADANSLVILTDVNKKHMISIGDYIDRIKNVIIIDHHSEDAESVKTDDKYISLDTSSASEVVSRVLFDGKVQIDANVANYLLAGISLDTKRFKQSTTSITHDVAEKLIDQGADVDYVNNLFLEEFESFCRISNLIINGTIIKKYSESLAPIQVSFTLNRNHPEEIYIKEDFAKAADRMMKFNGVDAAFALGFVEPGIIHISARGAKKVNVGKIMTEMKGGGNAQSAGGRIVGDDVFSVEEDLMSKIQFGLSEEEPLVDEPQVIKVKQIKKEKK